MCKCAELIVFTYPITGTLLNMKFPTQNTVNDIYIMGKRERATHTHTHTRTHLSHNMSAHRHMYRMTQICIILYRTTFMCVLIHLYLVVKTWHEGIMT